jgi:hypothetical protein
MGFFVHLKGRFECVRCKKASDTWFQTKILRSDIDNSFHTYSVGDSEILDGLDDYCPLHPWNGISPLVVAVGDWGCDYCGLNWQWAKAVFTLQSPSLPTIATVVEFSTLQPFLSSELEGIHYLESDLAELSGLFGRGKQFNWPTGLVNWKACSVDERSERVASGYRSWRQGVADLDPPV